VTSGSEERRQARACSRPPEPKTSTFTQPCYPTVLSRTRGPGLGTIRPGRGCRPLAEVKIQEGESIESALRRFKRKVQQEDIIKDIKKHSFYLKPGEKKRVKEALARKRSRKKARKEQD